jgi:hypothetical protein
MAAERPVRVSQQLITIIGAGAMLQLCNTLQPSLGVSAWLHWNSAGMTYFDGQPAANSCMQQQQWHHLLASPAAAAGAAGVPSHLSGHSSSQQSRCSVTPVWSQQQLQQQVQQTYRHTCLATAAAGTAGVQAHLSDHSSSSSNSSNSNKMCEQSGLHRHDCAQQHSTPAHLLVMFCCRAMVCAAM